MLALIAVAVTTLLAFTGAAVASVVTSPAGTTYTGAFKAHSEGYFTWHNAVGTISCNSTFEGKIERHGPSVTAGGNLSSLTFTACTNGTTHPSISGGALEFHPTGNGNAIMTSSGAKITKTMFGFECGYSTNNTTIGEVTAGEHATLDIKTTIPRTHGSFFCGSTANWTGSYKFTTPTNLAFS